MLTEKEATELARCEESMKRFDLADPDEVEPEEYEALLKRIVDLRKKRDVVTADDLKRIGSTPEAKSAIVKRSRFG